LALAVNFSIVFYGLKRKGLTLWKMFLTKGLTSYLQLFVGILELFSYSLRPLSLSIRLFANMVAGHILLIIAAVSTFVYVKHSFYNETIALYIDISILIMASLITLELAIAVIQAYVFTIMICLYLHDHINDTGH